MRKIFSIIYDLNRERRVSHIRGGDGGASANIATGLHQRIRRKFDSAIQHFPRCVLLWRLYLAFEKKMDDDKKYENVFYRATGIGTDSSAMKTYRLKTVYFPP